MLRGILRWRVLPAWQDIKSGAAFYRASAQHTLEGMLLKLTGQHTCPDWAAASLPCTQKALGSRTVTVAAALPFSLTAQPQRQATSAPSNCQSPGLVTSCALLLCPAAGTKAA